MFLENRSIYEPPLKSYTANPCDVIHYFIFLDHPPPSFVPISLSHLSTHALLRFF